MSTPKSLGQIAWEIETEGYGWTWAEVHDQDRAHLERIAQAVAAAVVERQKDECEEELRKLKEWHHKVVQECKESKKEQEMTQSIRDAAQALLDAIDSRLNDVVPYEQVAGLRAALSAPQPTSDERAADHMRLVAAAMRYSGAADDFATEDTYAAVEQSARALLRASQEDAEHAAMYRWLVDKCTSGPLTIARVGTFELIPWSGDNPDAVIRAAMSAKETK